MKLTKNLKMIILLLAVYQAVFLLHWFLVRDQTEDFLIEQCRHQRTNFITFADGSSTHCLGDRKPTIKATR